MSHLSQNEQALNSSHDGLPARLAAYLPVDQQTIQSTLSKTKQTIAGLKPVSDFFDRNRLSKPQTLSEFTTRLSFNIKYFANNYIILVLAITLLLLFTHLSVLFVIIFLLFGFKAASSLPSNPPLVVFGTALTPSIIWPTYGAIGFLAIWFSGATGTLLWVAAVCTLLVAVHAGLMDIPVEASFGGLATTIHSVDDDDISEPV